MDELESSSMEIKNECPICYLKIEESDKMVLPCNHIFHKKCITQNNDSVSKNKRSHICPYCRSSYKLCTNEKSICIGDNARIIYGKHMGQTVVVVKIMYKTVLVSIGETTHRVKFENIEKVLDKKEKIDEVS